jgi:peptide/nickel transport system ATP-binding protein
VTPLLQVEHLNVWFTTPVGGEVHAVRHVGLELDAGQSLGLVGESGCGKTTTAMALLGLLPASASVAGRVFLNGVDMVAGGEAEFRRHRWVDVAMVSQGAMNAFNPVRRIGDQIAEAVEVRGGLRRREATRRSRELLERVGVPPGRAQSYPHEFSGGMRQRAAIALALCCKPRLLIADEPTTALDVIVQAQIMQLLASLCQEQQLALVLVSHDLPLVVEVCQRVAVMYAGEVVEVASADVLQSHPAHPYSRLLFAATPDISNLQERPTAIPGTPPRLDREFVGCPFNPRCDRTFDRCLDDHPALRVVAPGHVAACHLDMSGIGS